MEVHGLVKVKTNSGATGHAITTPSVKPFEEIRAEADVSWIGELQWPAPYCPASVAVLATLSSLRFMSCNSRSRNHLALQSIQQTGQAGPALLDPLAALASIQQS